VVAKYDIMRGGWCFKEVGGFHGWECGKASEGGGILLNNM
jgi:hypothetical protein